MQSKKIEIHKQKTTMYSDWVEGNRWTSHTALPCTKVQIMMILHVGNSYVQVWGLIGSYN